MGGWGWGRGDRGTSAVVVTVIDSRTQLAPPLPHPAPIPYLEGCFDSSAGEDPARSQMENYQFISSVCLSPVSRLFP